MEWMGRPSRYAWRRRIWRRDWRSSLIFLAAYAALLLVVLVGALIQKARSHGDPAATVTPSTTTSMVRYSPAISSQWR
jgi:hypothetical protein